MLRAGRENELNQLYHEALNGRGIRRRFQAAQTEFEGTITGVDPLGRLLVESEGQVRSFHNKEIEYIR
jgi:biotin-(acetyl-CoA carboxylase) ligase